MIELESHAKAKRSELPLGFGNAADCVASYNPQKGMISIKIADGEKHSYVMFCTYADWKQLNERITAGLSFLHDSVEIPAHEVKHPPPPAAPQTSPLQHVVDRNAKKQAAAQVATNAPPPPATQSDPLPATQSPAPPDTNPAPAPAPYFSKGAKEARAASEASDQPQQSRGLPPVAAERAAPDFDPVTGEIIQ